MPSEQPWHDPNLPARSNESGKRDASERLVDPFDLQIKDDRPARKRVENALSRESDEQRLLIDALAQQRENLIAIRDALALNAVSVGQIEERLHGQIAENERMSAQLSQLGVVRDGIRREYDALTTRIDALEAQARSQVGVPSTSDSPTGHGGGAGAAVGGESSTMPGAPSVSVGGEAELTQAAWHEKWVALCKEWPELFDAAHEPNRRTFENLCDAFVELGRTCVTIDSGARAALDGMRRANDASDKLSSFIVRVKGQPKVLAVLKEALTAKRRTSYLADSLRALTAWSLALANGLFTAIAKCPDLAKPLLDPKNWGAEKGMMESQDAANGRHFREKVQNELPLHLGNELRREANDRVFSNYNDMMKTRREARAV